ncbi:HD-GYP domain-containing protein [Paenibacillus sp. Y412MC10]|uniref:HD-GYP domain-containing protein n=1 Tax=Geobacillus sp. (strain Y412MC10) TaxID=481743 RepID=UPI0011AB30DC|nr:HD-GYP domain-containing protein [Paenibacillus sp. Y412MC10]
MGTFFGTLFTLQTTLLVSMVVGIIICLALLYWGLFNFRRKTRSTHITPDKGVSSNHTLRVLSTMVEVRDQYTAQHSSNVAKYAIAVARSMGLSEEDCRDIYAGCILHDIGKIYVPDDILLKKGRLTEDEYNVLKEHPLKGYQIIESFKELKSSTVQDIVLYHHERYDGMGYPMGLSRDEIPLAARIVSICDAYDAITSTRTYRKASSPVKAISIIRENIGTQFDPDVANHFMNCIHSLVETTENAADLINLNYEKTS